MIRFLAFSFNFLFVFKSDNKLAGLISGLASNRVSDTFKILAMPYLLSIFTSGKYETYEQKNI